MAETRRSAVTECCTLGAMTGLPDTDLSAIVPDDKDWTWVVERPCPECGFDGSGVAATSVASMIRANADAWQTVLQRPPTELRHRFDRAKWTDLEYAAHVRDVYRLYLYRLGLMLDQDDPLFPNWDQNETAVAERYNEQEPTAVAADLAAAAEALASAFDGVTEEQWQRPGRRSDGASFTVDSFAVYLVHDPIHHLADVGA